MLSKVRVWSAPQYATLRNMLGRCKPEYQLSLSEADVNTMGIGQPFWLYDGVGRHPMPCHPHGPLSGLGGCLQILHGQVPLL